MKKLLTLFAILLLCAIASVKAQNPIPSFGFPVDGHANFQEMLVHQTPADNLEKREVVVRTSCGGMSDMTDEIGEQASCSAYVWVYSLDGQTILGPYLMHGGDVLRVEIDERGWGVFIEAVDHVIVDVWIE